MRQIGEFPHQQIREPCISPMGNIIDQPRRNPPAIFQSAHWSNSDSEQILKAVDSAIAKSHGEFALFLKIGFGWAEKTSCPNHSKSPCYLLLKELWLALRWIAWYVWRRKNRSWVERPLVRDMSEKIPKAEVRIAVSPREKCRLIRGLSSGNQDRKMELSWWFRY